MDFKLRLHLLKQSADNPPVNSIKVLCDHAGIQDMFSFYYIQSTEEIDYIRRVHVKHGNIITNNLRQDGRKYEVKMHR